MDHATNTEAALGRLKALMRQHANYGAEDTEGRHAIMDVEESVIDGKPFPFINRRNPFQLYSSIPGWETPSTELVEAARVYWKALIQERYKID